MYAYHEGFLLDTRLLEDGLQGGQSVLQHMLWADVHLSHHEEDWYLQCQCNPHVLFAHSNNAYKEGSSSSSQLSCPYWLLEKPCLLIID